MHSVGLLYLWSAESIRKGTHNGLEGALGEQRCSLSAMHGADVAIGASAVLFLSSAPRMMKGPIPATLTASSAIAGLYYGRTVYAVRSSH